MLPVFRAGCGGHIGSGLQWMSWIHRTDLCQIIQYALTNKTYSGMIGSFILSVVAAKLFIENSFVLTSHITIFEFGFFQSRKQVPA